MAESVDALVSNTSGATRAGSTPALGTRLKSETCCKEILQHVFFTNHQYLYLKIFWANIVR